MVVFKRKSKDFNSSGDPSRLALRFDGHRFTVGPSAHGPWLNSFEVYGLLDQIYEEGLATRDREDFNMEWSSLYEVGSQEDFEDICRILELPPTTKRLMSIGSNGALSEPHFNIFLRGWYLHGQTEQQLKLAGPILHTETGYELLSAQQWRLWCAIQQFSNREEKTDHSNRLAWGRIRKLAIEANARMENFLRKTVILTAESVEFELKRLDSADGQRDIEVTPKIPSDVTTAFDHSRWLRKFDSEIGVLDRYDIPQDDGVVQVIIPPKVKTVLREIKKIRSSRHRSARTEALILNPFATLGDDAKDVIDQEKYDIACIDAGLSFYTFFPIINDPVNGGQPVIELRVDSSVPAGNGLSEMCQLSMNEATQFVELGRKSIEQNRKLIAWRQREFLIQPETESYLQQIYDALHPKIIISRDDVFNLKMYSDRNVDIGPEKPINSVYIKRSDGSLEWIPENVVLSFYDDSSGSSKEIPLTVSQLAEFSLLFEEAKNAGKDKINVPWIDRSLTLSEAEAHLQKISYADEHTIPNTNPDWQGYQKTSNSRSRVQLICHPNVDSADYCQKIKAHLHELLMPPPPVEVPINLRDTVSLKQHQLDGLAWLQRIYRKQGELNTRGAILADDMGLGKTLQLLSMISWIIEAKITNLPILIVAPVALLSNWEDEAAKFFKDPLPLVCVHGERLKEMRVPRALIDRKLVEDDGLVSFLRPRFYGEAQIVLTTYEVIRDFEFSFAAEKWALMICDEAQKIKNPSALITRAAKKQNAQFKIACTGTPVENSLVDLWCLFDFIQPGYLGALNDFGRQYRRPIEATEETEIIKVEELRGLIEPFVLRRTKQQVAKDLPKKVAVNDGRKLDISTEQRRLYSQVVQSARKVAGDDGFLALGSHLQMIQQFRMICSHPVQLIQATSGDEPYDSYSQKSPKMMWLISCLESIKKRQEKAIVFIEFKDLQRVVQQYIFERLGYRPKIVNGDTSVSQHRSDNRRSIIDKFQVEAGFGVIILSPLAVGFGVNIQAANHVIHLTRHFNPAKEDQASDRAYRIGQSKTVYVYTPTIFAHDFRTFDVILDELLDSKRKLSADMLNGGETVERSAFLQNGFIPESGRAEIFNPITIDEVLSIDARYFEGLVAAIWQRHGFIAKCTPSSRDHGVDVIAIKGDKGVLIQVKSSSILGKCLGWDAVKEVVGGAAFYNERYPNVKFELACVTNQFFNESAKEQARVNKVTLYEQNYLDSALRQEAITYINILEFLQSDDWDN